MQGQSSLQPCGTKLLPYVRHVAGFRPLGRKEPAVTPLANPSLQNFQSPIAHRNHSSAVRSLTIRYEDDPILPVEILDADLVKLSLIPHSRISRKNQHIPEQLELMLSPATCLGRNQQLLLSFIVKSQSAPAFPQQFEFRNLVDQVPFFGFVKHPTQRS